MNSHLSCFSCLLFPGDKKGAKLTAKELESISNSFDESLLSHLRGLNPASLSLPWLSSAVDMLAFAHSAVISLVHEVELDDGGDGLSSWYLDDSLKVLDLCNCMSSEIERLCLHSWHLRFATELLRSDRNPLEEEIRQARVLLADSRDKGGDRNEKFAADIEELIEDLAASIRTSAPRGKVSSVERVVRHAIRDVSFLTVFIAGVISSALRPSPGPAVHIRIPKEFPWGDSIRTIELALIAGLGSGEEKDRKMWVLEELDDMEARTRHLLEAIDEVATLGGGGERMGRLSEAASGVEKAAEAMSLGVDRLREGVNGLFQTVMGIRKEMVDGFRARLWKWPSPKKPSKPAKIDKVKVLFAIKHHKVKVMPAMGAPKDVGARN